MFLGGQVPSKVFNLDSYRLKEMQVPSLQVQLGS